MRATGVLRFVLFGAIGFGVGGAIGGPLITFLPGGVALPLTILGGAVGRASLGAALGQLEERKLAAEQRPKVR
jgi:hypothetical protein